MVNTDSGRRRVVLVANGDSGHGRDDRRDARQALARANIEVGASIDVRQVDQLRSVLSADPGALVVAAGGDGTIGSVVEYVAGTPATLGILPLGTSNDIARSLNIPLDLDAAAKTIRGRHVRMVDVGELRTDTGHSRYFLHAAAIGLNVAFARFATRSSLRRRLGRLTYLAAAYLALRHRQPFDCVLEIDGQPLHLCLLHLSVVNAPVFGGFLGLRIPDSHMNDRLLDVVAVQDQPLWQLLPRMVISVISRDTAKGALRIFHVQCLVVKPARRLDVSIDGEVCAQVPGEFVTLAGSLRVTCPSVTEQTESGARSLSPPPSPASV